MTHSMVTFDVCNPCTGDVIRTCPRATPEDVDRVLQKAHEAFQIWKKRPVAERVKLQHEATRLIRERLEEISDLLAQELGRPLAGCRLEISRSADLLDFYAQEALRLKGEIPLHNLPGEKALVVREPVGVVVSITPFNYPITLLCMKIGAALPVGCTVVAKPSEDTPLSTILLADIFREAGFPEGVWQVITGFGHEIGDALVDHPLTAKIAFTGGTATGQRIAMRAAAQTKRVTLELGGQSPAIVCADADLAVAVPAIVKHAFANSGQFCYRVNRVYVHESIYSEFLALATEKISQITLGSPDTQSDMGPMINEKIFRNAALHIEDAKTKGVQVLTGGARLLDPPFDRGWFLPPTLLSNTDHSMLIMTAETFGPVLGVMSIASEEEGIAHANNSPFGLAAYVFSAQLGTGLRMAEQLDAGSVWVNNIHRSYQDVPFGGMKQSGIGREKGRHGVEDYTELKTIYLSY